MCQTNLLPKTFVLLPTLLQNQPISSKVKWNVLCLGFFYLFLFIELLGQPTEASWGIISNGNVKIYGWQQFVLSNEHAIKLSRGTNDCQSFR